MHQQHERREAREEMERLWRASEPETMNTFGIASEVCSPLKTRKEMVVQMEYENLKMSHIISEHKFSVEIQLERERNAALREELKHLQTNWSHKEDLKTKVKMSKDLNARNQQMVTKDALLRHMKEKIQTMKDNASEMEKNFLKDLEDLNHQQFSNNLENANKLHTEEEVNQGLRKELSRLQQEQEDNIREKEVLEKEVVALQDNINTMKDNASEMEKNFLKDLEDLNHQQFSNNLENANKLHTEEEVNQGLRKELSRLQQEQEDNIREKEVLEKEVVALQDNINTMKDNASETEKNFLKDLEDLNHQQFSNNLENANKLHTEEEVNQGLRKELSRLQQEQEDNIREKEVLEKEVVALQDNINTMKDNASETEKNFLKDLEDLNHQQVLRNLEHANKLQAKEEVHQGLRTELFRLQQEQEDNIREKEVLEKEVVALQDNINTMKDNASKTEKNFLNDLEDLNHQQVLRNLEHANKLQAKEEVHQGLRTELLRLQQEQEDTSERKTFLKMRRWPCMTTSTP
ncbi:ciliary rootlet coiled-coil protein 2-like [Pungitius pungitius]|uniref:ciliary rootlet coiled-coil protein 2-like n=1 Tax=Pungitius pungitius TaxID=134920 RepID=UPI002E111B77